MLESLSGRFEWCPLEYGLIKINFDRGTDEPNGMAGLGLVARIRGRRFQAAQFASVPCVTNPLVV